MHTGMEQAVILWGLLGLGYYIMALVFECLAVESEKCSRGLSIQVTTRQGRGAVTGHGMYEASFSELTSPANAIWYS